MPEKRIASGDSAHDRDRAAVAAGALLGTMTGDSLGANSEGAPALERRDDGGRLGLDRDGLVYTDDTQLTLALAEHLCDHPSVDPSRLAATFCDHYEPWRGYGAGMHALVRLWRDGVAASDAATAVFPDGSLGNGAAMRVAPVGVLWAGDPAHLTAVAARQARLTHVHPLGVEGAVLQARAVGLAATRAAFGVHELSQLAENAGTEEFGTALRAAVTLAARWGSDERLVLAEVAARLGNDVTAHGSVPAALWAAAVGTDFAHGIRLALGLGGDTDTIAAMAGGVLGAAGTDRAIPSEWLAVLEDGSRGRGYASALAARLAATRLPAP